MTLGCSRTRMVSGPQRRLWDLACLRRGGVGLASGALREDLHGDGLHGLGGARVAEHVDVIAALVDEAVARVVGLAHAAGLIAAVVGDRAAANEDEARTWVRVPAGGRARREHVVDDVGVGEPVRLESQTPLVAG